ncbi:hypothetical protein D9M71_379590 [compost metagenome]
MRRRRPVSAHTDHLPDINPLDPLSLELGQFAFQYRQRLWIRMPDHHRRTLLVREADRGLQLGQNRCFSTLIVEKYIP